MSAFVAEYEMNPGESAPYIVNFTGATSITAGTISTNVYRNGQDISAEATGTTPATILSGSTASSGVAITGEVLTIPMTGYDGSILVYEIVGTVDGRIVRPRIKIVVTSHPVA